MPRLDGFDGYHGQKEHGLDLGQTLLAGLWWIAWKVSQSIKYLDPTFAGVRSEWGGFRMRGMYHWLSSTTDVTEQVANFFRGIGIIQHGEFCMLDAEEKGITVAMCLLWCELVEAITHRPVVIYSGLYVAGGTIWNSPELRISKYGPRPFIVAAYVSRENLDARMTVLHALPFDGWQYSSNGPVPGVGTESAVRCDMDQIDNVAAFELACEISHITPTIGDDDMIRLLVPIDNDARFLANCTNYAAALEARWSGPADESGTTNAVIEFYRNAFANAQEAGQVPAGVPFEMALSMAAFANINLNGLLPPTCSADQFANPEEITARMSAGTVDNVARKGVSDLNASIATIGQEIGDMKMNLAKAGA